MHVASVCHGQAVHHESDRTETAGTPQLGATRATHGDVTFTTIESLEEEEEEDQEPDTQQVMLEEI